MLNQRTVAQKCADTIWNEYLLKKATAASKATRLNTPVFTTEMRLELTPVCNHRWQTYVGFSHSYEYCVHCPEKRVLK